MGDYLLLPNARNNGRAVYRSKEEVIRDQQSGYIYLYSFNADENTANLNRKYESDDSRSGIWMVSFINSSTIIKRIMK